jgi:hypothetical protein
MFNRKIILALTITTVLGITLPVPAIAHPISLPSAPSHSLAIPSHSLVNTNNPKLSRSPFIVSTSIRGKHPFPIHKAPGSGGSGWVYTGYQ